jgi:hypothetical protein
MKKPFKSTDFSDIVCSRPGCKTKIKKNVVARHPGRKSFECFKHHKQSKLAKQKLSQVKRGVEDRVR